ncbi:MAG: exodeoxyribonuclease V subunit alpha [Solirubrobacteraceae bacterium]
MSVHASQPDPLAPRLARHASGLLREFNQAGVLAAADVHVARRLGALGGEDDEAALLAAALAVRGPRLGHVHVDLTRIRDTAAVDGEEQVDLGDLSWPATQDWIARVRASPLVAIGDDASDGARPLRLVGTWLYLDRYWAEEVQVARSLRAMGDRRPEIRPDVLREGLRRLFGTAADGEGIDRAATAAAAAVRHRFAVVAGGPGTGKTTTVARIVALLCEQAAAGHERRPLIALAAPTGKAAARLQEAVHAEAAGLDIDQELRSHLRTLQASTIHRLLGWRPQSNSRFRHDRNQRLPHDVVIVDESSMVSLSLMARLIEALRADARLVLVGDPGQLASIEAGAVLGDIVGPADRSGEDGGEIVGPADRSGEDGGEIVGPGDRSDDGGAIVVLHRVHRFGGAIARLADTIRGGDGDAVMAVLHGGGDEITWIETDLARDEPPADVSEPALAAARETMRAARAGRPREALDALSSFRVLCAHRRGPYGVSTWTARIESWLAGEIEDLALDQRWYVGRPLLVTENDYELRLNNGDTGVVIRAGDDRIVAAFDRGGEETAQYSPSRLSAVDTVYAMTIHKSQGSQFDAAAVLLGPADSRILTRELLYTAVTRARRRLILTGTEEAVRAAVARPVARASGLGWRLWGDAAAAGAS